METTNNFNQYATSSIIDDLNFFFLECSSNKDSPKGEYTKMKDFNRFTALSNFPVLNGIIQTSSNQINISSKTIEDQINYFSKLDVPHIWWLTNPEQNEMIGPLLKSMGYISGGTYLGYAKQSDQIDSEKLLKMPVSSQIKVHEVQTKSEYQNFINVFANIFGLDEDTKQTYYNTQKDFGPKKTYRHFYASIDNKTVGVMTALLRNGWCGVWNGGVTEEARGKGVGRALCLKTSQIGLEENVHGFSGILMADAQAKGLCHKFGAEKVSELYPYLFGIKSEEFEPK